MAVEIRLMNSHVWSLSNDFPHIPDNDLKLDAIIAKVAEVRGGTVEVIEVTVGEETEQQFIVDGTKIGTVHFVEDPVEVIANTLKSVTP